jgi:hypothetical protein
MRIAANGPIRPYSMNRTAKGEEICAVLQPNSRFSGRRYAPGNPSAAEDTSMVRKTTPMTTHA